MSSFLKLSKRIINTRYITRIDVKPTEYKIRLATSQITGFVQLGTGAVQSESHHITLCKDTGDYEIVTNWLKRMEHVGLLNSTKKNSVKIR